ncbi:DUF6228 family protein [Streptomyces sp. NPDC088801]|uniref:DUF6228 family protein n=1 Tax=Streptomyces sp. NPDC088801 TaxID=3365903 RepID=UPI0038145A2B
MGDPGAARLLLSEPTRPFEHEPTLDFLLRACGPWGVVETPVQTWDGDGLDTFLASLAEDFRGWEGVRAWHSLCHDLTLSAEHRPGGHVQLTWGYMTERPPSNGTSRPSRCTQQARTCAASLPRSARSLRASRSSRKSYKAIHLHVR